MSYEQQAKEARIKVLELIYKAQTSHIGSNFSCIDILTVLFEKINLDKDKFILSAGWKAASLYYFLWRKGRITENELNSYCQSEKVHVSRYSHMDAGCKNSDCYEYLPSKFIGLSEPIHHDIPFAGGSMGMGLPAAVGFALAKKLNKEEGKIYVLMSDGEMQCGTTWESFLIADQHDLKNLVVIVDNNGFQAMGMTDSIISIPFDRLHRRIDEIHYIDGHNFKEIENAVACNQDISSPKFIVANTIKGKGVSFMENNNLYHYKAPSREEYEEALKELNN